MAFIFTWIVLSIIVGAIGSGRKIGFFGAFLVSVFLSPLIGLIFALISKSEDAERHEKEVIRRLDHIESMKRIERNTKTALDREDEIMRLDDRLKNGEISEYDYNLLKGEVLRRYQ